MLPCNSWARVCFFAVIPNSVPPLTVASLPMSMQLRPQTCPTPVIIVAPGGTPSYIPSRAK